MEQAVQAYWQVAASPEFREIQRLREKARHEEASALRHARDEARAEGKAEGRAEAVLAVLEDRKITAGKADRERILACADEPTLRLWLRRALRVPDISSLFADDAEDTSGE